MRKKILSMSIAAVMTAITSTGVMAFDTNGCPACDTDGPIRAPEVTASYEDVLKNRLKNDIPNITEAQIATKIAAIKGLKKLAGYQGNFPPVGSPASMTRNPHSPVQSVANLKLSPTNLGDALIFPEFNQAGGWGTEIVVRNTDQKHAIVAKVAVYSADKSVEVLDFNVYLSAADVVRFKIENGKLISTDGSVLRIAPTPSSGSDDVTPASFASEDHAFTRDLSIESGYVIVYGLAQASTPHGTDMRYHKMHKKIFKNYRAELDACRPGWRIGHQNAMVNGTYTQHTRASQSIPNYSVAAPNQAVNCNLSNSLMDNALAVATNAARLASQIKDKASAKAATDEVQKMIDALDVAGLNANADVNKAIKLLKIAQKAVEEAENQILPNDETTQEELDNLALVINDLAQATATALSKAGAQDDHEPGNYFGDVDASLTGTVRLYNATNGARDMILPATAIENYTSGNKMLHTEGEIIALQDRKIQGTDDTDAQAPIYWAKYNELGIRADARAFMVNNLSYNFAEESIANQLVITQPYKRVLVQLGNDDRYWQAADVGIDVDDGYWEDGDDNYGGYSFLYNVYDEHENIDPTTYTESPHNSGLFVLRNELQKMANLEKASTETFFNNRQELGQNAEKNGFALFSFTNMDGKRTGIPAIVTQMIGTTVGGAPQVNWIYSQTRK